MLKITLRQKLGKKECPYLIRTIFDFGWFSIRIHQWLGSDDKRAFHDHPWDFWTFVFSGGYYDLSDSGSVLLKSPCIAFRKAEHKHTVQLMIKPTWTILLTGPERRIWGFWRGKKFRKRNKWFYEEGHHPCDS